MLPLCYAAPRELICLANQVSLSGSLQVFKERKWLGNISYKNGRFEFGQTRSYSEAEDLPKYFAEVLSEAGKIVAGAAKAAQKIPVPDQVRVDRFLVTSFLL